MKKKFAIIGAGIAGLTFANLIKKKTDHDFILYEKEESFSIDEGYGIQLSPNSIKILNKINFQKIDKDKIFYPTGLDFYDIKNEKICNLDLSQFNNGGNSYITLQRSTLIELLKSDIYNQHLRFGKRIKEVSEIKGKVLIKFDDNTNDLVDFVVGADGIFSNTKSFFEKKKNKPQFQKAIAIRKIIKSKLNLNINENRISLMMGSNCHIVIYPINKSKELNLVCIVRENKYNPEETKLSINRVVNQNQNLKNIFEGELRSWPLYSSSKIFKPSNDKVFYIGDAFNGFLPTLAQGAGQSIESAFELFNLLKEEKKNINEIYFLERLKRVKLVKRRSNFNFFLFHLSGRIFQTIRNFLIKFLIKRKVFINSYLGIIYRK